MLHGMVFRKETGVLERNVAPSTWPALLKDEDAVLLVDGEAVDGEDIPALRDAFHLHPLEIETLARKQKRPKVHQYEHHFHLVLHSPILERQEYRVRAPELDIIVGRNFLVICRWGEVACVTTLLKRIQKSPAEMFGQGTDGLLYALIDELVDNYQPVLDRISGLLAGIEERIMRHPTTDLLGELSGVKRQLLGLRRIAIPQGETILLLSREEMPVIDEHLRIYFRDLCDRLNRVADIVEAYRDIVTGARDTYLSVVSNRMNEVMQTLTIIATIMMPLTLIAGIYGMNFLNMPELRWQYGYPTVMAVMVVLSVVMILVFRRKMWM